MPQQKKYKKPSRCYCSISPLDKNPCNKASGSKIKANFEVLKDEKKKVMYDINMDMQPLKVGWR